MKRIYKIDGGHLTALGMAAGIIVAFLERVKAEDALLNFDAATALMKLRQDSHTRTHAHTVCKCKNGAAAVVTGCKKTVKAAKAFSMKELASELGVDYKAVKSFAYRKKLGAVRRGPLGHLVRELSPADAKAIRAKFKK